MRENRKILLITTDNHTIGVQTVANIVLKKTNMKPEMFYLPFFLPEYPEAIGAKILNKIVNEIDDTEGKVLVGFHLKELSLKRTLQLAFKIKRCRGNKVKLVAGGTYATLNPSSHLDIFDYVVVGSGEGILAVIDAVLENKAIEQVVVSPPTSFEYPLFSNSWVLDEDGKMKKKRLRPLVHPQYRNKKAIEIMLGFGCSYSCSYCEVSSIRKIFGNRYKIISANAKKAIALLKREIEATSDVQYIYFFDEDFLLKPNVWIENFSYLYKEQIKLPFFIFATPYSVLRFPDKLIKLSQAGLDTINIGIQSGCESTSKGLFGRKENKEEIKSCVQTLVNLYLERRVSSPPMLDFIILNPYETPEAPLETIHLLQTFPTPFKAIMHCMSFFRGTPLYYKAVADGKISTEYLFKYDLHDFISRVKENELKIRYSDKKSVLWLFLNVILYGMNGLHQKIDGKRYFGSMTEERFNELINLTSKLTYHDIISLAESFPNPMKDAKISLEEIDTKRSNIRQLICQAVI